MPKWALSVIHTSPDQLVMYPTGPGEPRRLGRGPITDYRSARWYPDGKRVLVCGGGPAQASRCYAQEIDGGDPRAVTPEGTTEGYVSPDGRLAVVSHGAGQFLLCPLDGGDPRPLPFLGPTDTVSRWASDGRSLIVYQFGQVPNPLERVDLETGRRELIRKLAPVESAGVLFVRPIIVTNDLTAYAYSAWRRRSSLFLIGGAR